MANAPSVLDIVELLSPEAGWPAGTIGTVVEDLADGVVMVEIVGPDGSALGFLDLPGSQLRIVEPSRPLVPSGQ